MLSDKSDQSLILHFKGAKFLDVLLAVGHSRIRRTFFDRRVAQAKENLPVNGTISEYETELKTLRVVRPKQTSEKHPNQLPAHNVVNHALELKANRERHPDWTLLKFAAQQKISRVSVFFYFRVLMLAPRILKKLGACQDRRVLARFTLKKLNTMSWLPHEEQIEQFDRIWASATVK